ncbi:hypothetical protein [Streptococcus caprae]|uniref:Uncharacterized protein n=1 Tax=Streptococcus caprae TaxID=1640501 RepID=A0ABV8CWU1_9STRE
MEKSIFLMSIILFFAILPYAVLAMEMLGRLVSSWANKSYHMIVRG